MSIPTSLGVFDTPVTLSGPVRHARQLLTTQTYDGHASIHDNDTARRLGFRAGAIEGPTHFSLFDPLAITAWGDGWFETGCISAHFQNPVYEGDGVCASLELPTGGARRGRILAASVDNVAVLHGTATVDPRDDDTEVRARLARARPPTNPRIIDRLAVGDRTGPEQVRLGFNDHLGPLYPFSLADKLSVITESVRWYEPSFAGRPWGTPVIPIEMVSVLAMHTAVDAFPIRTPSVGLFLDLEVRLVAGPLRPDTDYLLEREIVSLGESRRTESFWIRCTLRDAESDTVRATVLLHNGVLKDSYAGG